MSEKKDSWALSNGFWYVVILMASFTGVIAFFSKDAYSLPDNTTLITEVGVGIIITIVVYRFAKKSEKKNKELLDDVKKILYEEKSFRDTKICNLNREIEVFLEELIDVIIWTAREIESKEELDLEDYQSAQNYLEKLIKENIDVMLDIHNSALRNLLNRMHLIRLAIHLSTDKEKISLLQYLLNEIKTVKKVFEL